MNWITKTGKVIKIEDMKDSHAKSCIKMFIKNTSSQHILQLIMEADKIRNNQKKTIKLRGDMAQQFNDTYPGDEYDEEWQPWWEI